MERQELAAYGSLCIRFRVVAAAASTLVFLTLAPQNGHTALRCAIAAGMLSACALGNCLYKKLFVQQGSKAVFYLTLGIELVAYGVFTLLSGGVASPYLWYYFGSLMLLMAAKRTAAGIVLILVWCFASLTLSRFFMPGEISPVYMTVNLCFGAATVLGSSAVICVYVRRLSEQQQKQAALNRVLLHEKELNHQALDQITDLYNTFALFAMTQPERVTAQLADTLCRTLAPAGCALIKYGDNAEVEQMQCRNLPPGDASEIARGFLAAAGRESCRMAQAGRIYEVHPVGAAGLRPAGLVLWPAVPQSSPEESQRRFYLELTELVFKNLDSQKQLEALVVAEEKSRITDEIHDTVIQRLFGIACRLKRLEDAVETLAPGEIGQELEALEKAAEQTMTELRRTIYGKGFEGETFAEKVRQYLDEVQRLSDAKLELDLDENVEQMTSAQKIAAYRIICEAVSNALRHGKATRATVSIGIRENCITLNVADNGEGMVRRPARPLEGNGLNNIDKMVKLLAGQVSIGPGTQRGVQLTAQMPLH